MSKRPAPRHCYHTVLVMMSSVCLVLPTGHLISLGCGQKAKQLSSRLFRLYQAVPLCPGSPDPQRTCIRAQLHTCRPQPPHHSPSPIPSFCTQHITASSPKSILYTAEPRGQPRPPDPGPNYHQLETVPACREVVTSQQLLQHTPTQPFLL
jgi:hypothetical protein